tara:strand:- start:33 stop:188 length:156 start_codon:yes stop_codon:yes gene_type:complete
MKAMGESKYWKTYDKEVHRLLEEIENYKNLIKNNEKEIEHHTKLLSEGLGE